MDSIFHGFSKIDEDFYEELEEVLIMGDLGVKATYAILDDLRKKVKEQHIKEPVECKAASDRQYQRADGCRRDSLSNLKTRLLLFW